MTKRDSGEILVLVFVTVGVVLFTVLFIIAGAQLYYSNSSYTVNAEKATALAEAGVDKAINSLNKSGGSYNGESETILGDGSYAVAVVSKDAATKVIEATGYVPNKAQAIVKRTIKIIASRGIGASFIYGIQVGEGGLELGNNNQVQGTIYSNGNITAGNNNVVTGDAWVAGGVQPNPNQQTDCEGANCQDYIFGKSVNGEDRLDIAQSFKPGLTETLNKISIKIKKQGNPPDLTVRIMRDDNGKPDKNGVITTGTLFSNLVATDFGLIDVTFSTSPQLLADTTYWLMLDTSADNSNFWIWQNDLAQSYTRGSPSYSANWSAGNPKWNNFAGDLSFKTFMGGTITSIRGGNNFQVNNEVHANTIENLTIGRDAYYQTIINSTVAGNQHPSSADPPPKVFPISEANVTEWKSQAQANSLTTPVCGFSWGPGKYTGSISLGNSCTITIKSPIWITGSLTYGNSNTLKLSSEYGSTSGLMIVDGKISLGNTNHLEGTGVDSSLLMVLTTYDSRINNEDAVTIGNIGNTGVFYADKGIINPGNSNQFKELTAWKIRLTNNSTINYETGLSSTLFSSGPSGSYSLVKGTYQLK